VILNNGNIKKSKLLRYIILDDVSQEEYIDKITKYHKTIETQEFKEYLEIEKFIHDSKIDIKITKNQLEIRLEYWKSEIKKLEQSSLIFKNGKIVSWNKIRKSGHISRQNTTIKPYEYGYDEFYEYNGQKYVTILIFTKPGSKVNTGIYYPIITIRYDKMEVKRNA